LRLNGPRIGGFTGSQPVYWSPNKEVAVLALVVSRSASFSLCDGAGWATSCRTYCPFSPALTLDGCSVTTRDNDKDRATSERLTNQGLDVGDTMDSLPPSGAGPAYRENEPQPAREHGPQAGDRST